MLDSRPQLFSFCSQSQGVPECRTMPGRRRFPPPWAIVENRESFVVVDGTGQALAYLYFEDEPQRQMSMRRLSKDEAYRIARGITRLPALLTRGEVFQP